MPEKKYGKAGDGWYKYHTTWKFKNFLDDNKKAKKAFAILKKDAEDSEKWESFEETPGMLVVKFAKAPNKWCVRSWLGRILDKQVFKELDYWGIGGDKKEGAIPSTPASSKQPAPSQNGNSDAKVEDGDTEKVVEEKNESAAPTTPTLSQKCRSTFQPSAVLVAKIICSTDNVEAAAAYQDLAETAHEEWDQRSCLGKGGYGSVRNKGVPLNMTGSLFPNAKGRQSIPPHPTGTHGCQVLS